MSESEPTAPVVRPTSSDGARPAPGWLLAAIALALLLRAVSWAQSTLMMNDGPDFLWQAGRMLAGDWDAALSHPYLPLYAAATAGIARLVGDLVLAGLLVSMTGGVLLVVASWGLGARVPGARLVAPCAALAAAVNVRAVNYGADIQSDGLFAGLVLCALWAGWTSHERAGCARSALGAGLLTGLAYLTRYEGLYLCVPWALLLSTALVTGRARAAMLRASLAFALGLLACASPYVVQVHELTGVWAVSIKPSALRMALADADEFVLAPAESPLGWPFVPRMKRPEGSGDAGAAAEDEGGTGAGTGGAAATGAEPAAGAAPAPAPAPARGAGTEAESATETDAADSPPPPADGDQARAADPSTGLRVAGLGPAPSVLAARSAGTRSPTALLSEVVRGFVHVLRGEGFVLALAGACVLWARRRALLLFLLATSAGWLAVLAVHLHVNGYLSNRHHLTAIVPMLPVCGAGIAWFGAAVTWRRVVLALALFESARAATWPQRDDKAPRLDALAWVREHTSPEQWFLTQRRRDGFYAERRAIVVNMPCRDDSLRKRLRLYDAPYAVFSLDSLEEHQPRWLAGNGFEEVARFSEAGETVLVLRPTFDGLRDEPPPR